MSTAIDLPNLVLTQRLADGAIEWIPLTVPQRVPADPGAAYALIDRGDYAAPDALVARREGDDLIIAVGGRNVLVLDGFFVTPAVAFYPTPDVAGGAGPFSGAPITAESPVLAGSPESAQIVWSAEPIESEPPPATATPDADSGSPGGGSAGGGVSPLVWVGLGVGGLGLVAGGGGGGSGGGSSDDGGPSDTTPPQITSGTTAQSVPENSGAGQVIYTATGTDTSAIRWSLAASGDAAAFSINSSTGAVTLTANPDFETKSSYSFTVVATDTSNNRSQQTVSLSIVDRDDAAPIITSGATATAVDENSGAGQTIYTGTATDQGAVTWSLKNVDDAAAFGINANTGAVTLIANPDHETKSSYRFTVVATDEDGNRSEQSVNLAINDLDEVAPTITSAGTATALVENSGANQIVYTVTSTDTGDISTGTSTYSLSPTGDGGAFTINSTTGAVRLTANPDFETKSSYSFTVVATDAANNRSQQTVSLSILDQDDAAPIITSGATATAVDENSGAGQTIYTGTATDQGAITWSLKNVDDAAAFGINANTGAVTLIANPDHETKSSYRFTVVATDEDGNRSEQSVNLAINDLDEVAPTITSAGTATALVENSGANQVVYTVTSTDTGDIRTGATTYSLSPAGDGSAFTINSTTGAVRLTANPDFETKSSYSFTVVATDAAGNSSQLPVSLAITDIVDESGPVVSSVALTGAVGAQNGTLNAGDTAQVTVTMSENTIVSTAGGTPRIALTVGSSVVFATYASGSNSSNLVFTYVVQPGDTDTNGISIASNALQLNGGSLTDTAGNAATLSHASVAANPSFLVDTTAPALASSVPADGAVAVAPDADIVLTFDEEVRAGSGNITISNGTDIRSIAVTDATQVAFSGNEVTINLASDLLGGNYNVQIASGAILDAAGNAYPGINNSSTLNFGVSDSTVVVFDLVQGSSSDHSGRSFQADVSYDIYIRVDSETDTLLTSGGGPGTWGTWSGANNLGSDDRIILVGNGDAVIGQTGSVTQVAVNATAIAWQSSGTGPDPARLAGATLTRAVGTSSDDVDSAVLFDSSPPTAFIAGQAGQLNTMYLTNMPAGILTSQGLV